MELILNLFVLFLIQNFASDIKQKSKRREIRGTSLLFNTQSVGRDIAETE